MKKICLFISLLFCFLMPGMALAQNYEQQRQELIKKQQNTRSEIDELTEQIQRYEERIKLADRKYEALYSQYENLQRQIALQDEKLSKLQEEQSQIQEEMDITTKLLSEKRDELTQLIDTYKKTLSYLYKHGRTSQLALIFSSSSINQMLVRSYYLEKFNGYREDQERKIRNAEEELERSKAQLEQAKSKNADLLTEIKQEQEKLAEKEEQQAKNVALLRQNKLQIQRKQQEARQRKEMLNNTLARIIEEREQNRKAEEERLRRREAERKQNLANAEEIENDLKRAREIAKYSQPVDRGDFMSSEAIREITESFASSKGALPWPVESRTIAEHFGNQRHPVYGTVTPNLGIEIVTDSQARIHVVHSGYVLDILPLPGYGDVILVKHGRFMTAYGNLSEVMVRKGQSLRQGDVIGLSGEQESVMGESLFFMIREENSNLDPEEWLGAETVSSKY